MIDRENFSRQNKRFDVRGDIYPFKPAKRQENIEKKPTQARWGVTDWTETAVAEALQIAESNNLQVELRNIPMTGPDGTTYIIGQVLVFPQGEIPSSFRDELDERIPASERFREGTLGYRIANSDHIRLSPQEYKNKHS